MKASDIPVHALPEIPFLASDQSAAFGDHIPSHRIDFYALIWFSESKGTHLIDFESYPVKKDTVYLLSRNQVHSIPATKLPQARVLVWSTEFFQQIEEPQLRQLFLPFHNEGIAIPKAMVQPLTRLFELILLEYSGAADVALLLKYVTALLTHLFRFAEHQFPLAAGKDQRMGRLFQLVQDHYKDERSTIFYAREIGLTPKRINEILREKMGSTISQLVYHLLIIEAKRELYRQDLSVKEIAYELGFSEQSYFARFFKKHTGTTPEQFRETASSVLLKNARSQKMFK